MCFPTDLTARIPLRKASNSNRTTTKVLPIKRSRTASAKRSVRFSEITSVAYRHVSKEDLQKTWNQRSDIHTIKNNIRSSILALEKANGKLHQVDSEEHSFRGLESGICPTIHKLRKLWIKTVKQNVLQEQRIQKSTGMVDFDRLGEIARSASRDAVRCANKMGLLDAKSLLKKTAA